MVSVINTILLYSGFVRFHGFYDLVLYKLVSYKTSQFLVSIES